MICHKIGVCVCVCMSEVPNECFSDETTYIQQDAVGSSEFHANPVGAVSLISS